MVDDEEYLDLIKFNWHISGGYAVRGKYIYRTKKTTTESMHRVIMKPPSGMEVDHINHNKLDNRKINLRICTHSENFMNRNLQRNSTSGVRGVSWNKLVNKWQVQIAKDHKHFCLGYFLDIKEASKAYEIKARELFGEFYYSNLNPELLDK